MNPHKKSTVEKKTIERTTYFDNVLNKCRHVFYQLCVCICLPDGQNLWYVLHQTGVIPN